MRTAEFDYAGARILLIGSVRGLTSEAAEVAKEFARFAPDAVALPVGPRELEEIEQTLADKADPKPAKKGGKKTGPTGIKDETLANDPVGGDIEDLGLFVSSSDMVYLRKLARYGDVEMPPPSYQEALGLARKAGLPCFGVDLDDEGYTDAFIANISLYQMWRQGRRLRKMMLRKFTTKDAEAFALQWDVEETRVRGYFALQQAREQKMANGLAVAAREHARLLAVIEIERMGGAMEYMRVLAGAAERAVPSQPKAQGESPSQA
jgi:hypothetical protein